MQLDELARSINQTVERLLQQRFKAPAYVTLITRNGAALIVRYKAGREGLRSEILAEHIPPDGMFMPVNMFITDSEGEMAGRYRLDESGWSSTSF
jgi:hypothetical protein